jgi:hypothetical protein
LVVVTVDTVPEPIGTPLLVKATEAGPHAPAPPVSTKAVNVVLPPWVIGLALDETSVTVGVWLTVNVVDPVAAV